MGNPVRLRQLFSQFNNPMQQDVSEFLQYLVGACIPLKNLCESIGWETSSCQSCGQKTERPTTSTLFSVPLNGKSVQENLNKYWLTKETIQGAYCDDCCPEIKGIPENQKKYINRTRTEVITEPAEIIMVSIKRFTNNGRKLMNHVDANRSLTIVNTTYDLRGIITHSGRVISAGHYYIDLILANGQQVRCNDWDVSNIQELSKLGYLFIYEKSSGQIPLLDLSIPHPQQPRVQ